MPSHSPRSADALEARLRAAEGRIAAGARRAARAALWRAAASYLRSERMLADLLPPALLRCALAEPADPAVTWQVLRCLCRHIRFNARSPLGSAVRLRRCRMIAAGEVRVLARQKIARRDHAFLSSVFDPIGRLAS